MIKIEVTDEAVERAFQFMRGERFGGHAVDRSWCRDFLDAALNPPPEPEIVVTEEMLEAGTKVWDKWAESARFRYFNLQGPEEVYRAMRALEPKQPEKRSGKDRGGNQCGEI